MHAANPGHYQVGTATVSASGATTVIPTLCDQVYKGLSVNVIPKAIGPYQVDLYLDGALLESHTYTSTTVLENAYMSFPNKLFPPNVGTATHPGLITLPGLVGFDPGLAGMQLIITNDAATVRYFTVYSIFEALNTVAKKLSF